MYQFRIWAPSSNGFSWYSEGLHKNKTDKYKKKGLVAQNQTRDNILVDPFNYRLDEVWARLN